MKTLTSATRVALISYAFDIY